MLAMKKLRQKLPRVLRTGLAINGGRDTGDEVEIPDPDGNAAVVVINRTQRMAERLHAAGQIDADQLAAATELRDAWERAGLEQKGVRGGLRLLDGGHRDIVNSEDAWTDYCRMINQIARDDRRIIIAVVIHDEDPVAYGQRWRAHGLTWLRRALEQLGRVK